MKREDTKVIDNSEVKIGPLEHYTFRNQLDELRRRKDVSWRIHEAAKNGVIVDSERYKEFLQTEATLKKLLGGPYGFAFGARLFFTGCKVVS